MNKRGNHCRFFVYPENIIRNTFISRDKQLLNQIKNVFRLKKGNQINIFDGSGYDYTVEIVRLGKDVVEGNLVSKEFKKKNEHCKTNLFCPVLKGNNFDLVLQKCTELGVSSFFPVLYHNAVVKVSEKKDRWNKILKESSEQCGRFDLPTIQDVIRFDDIWPHLDEDGAINIVADMGGGLGVKDIIGIAKNGRKVNIVVGPEGGFSDGELEKMRDKECLFLRLNGNTLRAETACILVVGILSSL